MKIPNLVSLNHGGSGLVSRESQFGSYLVSHSTSGQERDEITTKAAERVAVDIIPILFQVSLICGHLMYSPSMSINNKVSQYS